MPHWPAVHKGPFVLALDNMYGFLKVIGDPHEKLPPVIHVAGTNGKGSTIAQLNSIMLHAGYSCHRYTSPHIVEFCERIVLNDKEISSDELHACLEECRVKSQDIAQPSFFEGTTGAAFLLFSRKDADALLLEVGMGGRLDATNVIKDSIMSIITPISFDHVEYLGETLYDIAKEKAGIIKAGSYVISSWQTSDAMRAIQEKCDEVDATLIACGRDWSFARNDDDSMTVTILYNGATKEIHIPKLALKGIHQYINASTAVVAAYYLGLLKYDNITERAIASGIARAYWPGRLERIERGRLAELLKQGDELWFDGAHNIAGAEMLAASLADMNNSASKRLYIINGRTGNRDPRAFLQFFVDLADMVCGVFVTSEPSAEKPENIASDAQELGLKACTADDLEDAVLKCLRDAQGEMSRIVICGSLYLAGDIEAYNK